MTDQHHDDRAEAAFRDALASHAADEPFRPLVLEPRRSPGWQPGWLRSVAAAAVVLAVCGFGFLGLRALLGVGGVPGLVAAVPAEGRAEASTASGPDSAENKDTDGGTGMAIPDAIGDDWRYESFADILVQVPVSWGYGDAPGSDWCADGTAYPRDPYVDTVRGLGAVRAILCTGTIPTSKLAMHLTFGFGKAPTEPLPKGWGADEVAIGDAFVRVVRPDDQAALAREILATATRTTQDHNGCATRSPIGSGTFAKPSGGAALASVESVDEIAVCQYEVTRAALVASTQLTGSAAADELAALQRAPLGGGPDNPADCLARAPEGTALVLHLRGPSGDQQVYVYYSGCTGNGFFDGVQPRALTAEACTPLVRDPVTIRYGNGPTVTLCLGLPTPAPTK